MYHVQWKQSWSEGKQRYAWSSYIQEDPRGGNESEGTLAGDQSGEEPKQCKGSQSTAACFSLCGDLAGHKSVLRDFKDCIWVENSYQNAEHLGTF